MVHGHLTHYNVMKDLSLVITPLKCLLDAGVGPVADWTGVWRGWEYSRVVATLMKAMQVLPEYAECR